MKTKKLVAYIMATLCVVSVGCSEKETTSEENSTTTESETIAAETTVNTEIETTNEELATTTAIANIEKASAIDVYNYLLSCPLNIGTYVEYDENTDTNGLLGRPGQYTSKINFEITTLQQCDDGDPVGGSIEVFETNEDAKKRSEYIQSITQGMSALGEYNYINDCVLLRIDYDVAPSDATNYEQALNDFVSQLNNSEN